MSDNDKAVEDIKYTAEKFAEEYKALCDKAGYRIIVNPAWMARDDGSWSMVLQTSVGEVKKS